MIQKSKNTIEHKKILVVDDDEGILDAISLILEDEGYAVETTPDGNETFEKAKTFHPDTIILDALLSGSDGRVICKNFKNNPKTQDIPIIMISAHPTIERSVSQSGADAFLPKPFEAEELLKIVAKYTN